jgi:hypothetical protein
MGGKNGDGDAGPEFLPGSVLLEDLNMLAADGEALGLRVVLHCSNRPAISEADAFAICHRREVEIVESERQHAAMLAEQATWLVERDNVYRRTQAEVLGPRGGSPPLVLKAREAAVAAVLEFERRNPPEKVGWNSSIRSTPPPPADADEELVH